MDTRKKQQTVIDNTVSESGFTFIEVIIALTLLAVATSVLIGLQGSAMARTLRDRNVQQAMLAARRIMASIETTEDNLTIGDQTDVPVADLLRQLNAPEASDEDEKKNLGQLRATLKLEDWPLPINGLPPDAIRKLTLSILWGSDPLDTFEITYFPPGK